MISPVSNGSRLSPGRWGAKLGTKPGSGGDQEPEASRESWIPLTQPWESMRMPHATVWRINAPVLE